MKKKHLLILAGSLFLLGVALFSFQSNDKECCYVPRDNKNSIAEKSYVGAMEWLTSRRVDKNGEIKPEAVEAARRSAFALSNQKATGATNVQWQEMGPDNVGGRTRAILYDRNNHNIVYAGAVSGGLWRSTTGGQAWSRTSLNIVDENDLPLKNLNVSCITQAANGDIYFGTGELSTANGGLSSLMGGGIWKSTDGINFKRLASTWGGAASDIFNFVQALGSDPNNPQRIYAATVNGLRISQDGGVTWNGISTVLDTKVCRDLKVNSDGDIIASINDKTYISYDNGVTWETSIAWPRISGGRLEYGIAPNDPNYFYCQAAFPGELQGIYRSKDKGQTWDTIGPGGYVGFQPTGTQGVYDNVISAFPDDPEKILVGGQSSMWSFSPENSWEVIANGYVEHSDILHYYYVHADHHAIAFHPDYDGITNATVLIGTDGGVFISENGGITFNMRNKNYNVTQFYAISADGYGHVMGGTQDNGTQINLFNGNSDKNFFEVLGGDGGYSAMSLLDPRVTFASIYYGNLQRSQEKGRGYDTVGKYFFSNYLLNRYFAGLEENIGNGNFGAAGFVTLYKLWEHPNDQASIDSVTYTNENQLVPLYAYSHFEDSILNRFTDVILDTFHFVNSFSEKYVNVAMTLGAGEKLIASSQVYENPIEFELPYSLYPEEQIRVKDPFQAMLAMPLRRNESNEWNIMLTRKPLHFNVAPVSQPWSEILPENIQTLLNGGTNSFRDLEFSADGNYLFFAFQNRIFRVSGLTNSRTQAEMTADSASYGLEVKQIGSFGEWINGIGVDPNNPDNVIVGLSGFGTNNVYFSNNATAVNPNFTSKAGALPLMPVFDGIINCLDGTQAMIATEFGIYTTDDITENIPEWVEQNNNSMGPVVTPAIYQQILPNQENPHIENYGEVYIGTHGRGIFKTDVWKGSVAIEEPGYVASSKKSTFKIFPNPVIDKAQVELSLISTEEVELMVFDLQGKMVKQVKLGSYTPGKHKIDVDFTNLNPGSYLVNMVHGNASSSTKIMVF